MTYRVRLGTTTKYEIENDPSIVKVFYYYTFEEKKSEKKNRRIHKKLFTAKNLNANELKIQKYLD